MFTHYLKIAFRNLIKYKGYSLINIVGLATGLAVFALIASYVDFHRTFNRFHKNVDRIFSVVQVLSASNLDERHSARIPAPLSPLLLREFPEIEDATRCLWTSRPIIRHKKKAFYEEEGFLWAVDSNFLTFFTFEIIAGDPAAALAEPKSVVLTQSVAHKYFGNENPLGQRLTLWNDLNVVVTGVTRDVPSNSSLRFDALISLSTFQLETKWDSICTTFVRVAKQANPETLERKFAGFSNQHSAVSKAFPQKMYLLPFADLNLNSRNVQGIWRQESQAVIFLTFTIGIVLLMIVCFNFMNLATAQFITRAKEVGVRKAFGAAQTQLRWQLISESIVIALIAFALALVLYEIMRPPFVFLITEDPTRAGPGLWNNPLLILKLIGVTIFVGMLAGSYPAIFLSRLKAARILKEYLPGGKKSSRVQQLLIISQFMVAIFTILVSIMAFKQSSFLYTLDLGYTRDRVLAVMFAKPFSRAQFRSLAEDLQHHPDILDVAAAVWAPTNWNARAQVILKDGNDQEIRQMNTYGIDYDFIELLEMKIVQGRSFSRPMADTGSYIINETAARRLNRENPIGEKLSLWGKEGPIVGVVKDFHFKSLSLKISPTVLYLRPTYLNTLVIKLTEAPVSRVLNSLDNRLHIFAKEVPFKYSNLNERLNDWLLDVRKWAALAAYIGIIALLFSCFGLLGLSSYVTKQKTKEIGIRKAYGATLWDIIQILLSDFVRLILIANIIALPVSYYVITILSQRIFAYSTQPGIGVFLLTGALVMVTGITAVSTQAFKAAKANPVEALRYE
jgi:putative ABC transport system permease protein